MKRVILIAGILFCFVSFNMFAQEDQQQQQEQQIKTEPANGDFLQKAVSGGKMEVELGQLAMNKAGSETVKQFGERMVQDHSKANDELMEIIRNNNLSIPKEEMLQEHKEIVDDLSNRYGLDFDTKYMNLMVKDHSEDVEAFEKAAANHENEAVRSWAEKTLPVLKEHFNLAKTLNKMMQKSDQNYE